jgi:DNA-binding transcriptional MocR family regulator
LSDEELTRRLEARGMKIRAMSHYYHDRPESIHILVVNYAILSEDALDAWLRQLPDTL